jgi:gamma-glutamylcysteine synthetase
MLVGGKVSYGSFNPETSTLIIEFAHAAGTDAWHALDASVKATSAIQKAAQNSGYNLLALGGVPTADLEDIRCSGSVLPYQGYVFSYENMKYNRNNHISQTTFGNASFHYNQGFNDPEKFVRYARATLYLQPLMTALMANSPVVKQAVQEENGKIIKSSRSRLMQSYERFYGVDDLSYSYPDFMLDFNSLFADVVTGYMNQPLGRNVVDGQKVFVGNMTMTNYLDNGFEHEGKRYFPERKSIDMMFSEPIVDVRLRPFDGPRIETRAHDGGAFYMSAALNAFYRGINANLDNVEEYLRENISPQEVRYQRQAVCFEGINGFVKLKNNKVISHHEFASDIMALAEKGLIQRGLNEEQLLEPLQVIIQSGKTYADCQIDFVKANGGRIDDKDMSDFMRAFDYASVPMVNGASYKKPIKREVDKKRVLSL